MIWLANSNVIQSRKKSQDVTQMYPYGKIDHKIQIGTLLL